MANRHRQQPRNTSTERQCPTCLGAGELTRNDSWNSDPQREYPVPCTNSICMDGWVRWAALDPLEIARGLRRRRYHPTTGVRYGEAMARALTDVSLPGDVQPMTWRVAA
ncbi:hypothetical protein [Xanthomonas campestris]|uniref:hypothetical protein n=1 Tax=Xanthomonas campestris TaxID=339 RepID=UPI000E32AB0E|nr:hypothetical protein [Xanthomonas campestris]RFF46210.1 hypothetical protein D0A35_18920 [Xanthomonas campestris]